MEALIVGVVLLVAAVAVNQYVPGPLGSLVAILLGVVGAVLVVLGLLEVVDEGGGVDRDVVAPVGLLAAYRARRCLRSEN